MYDLSISHGVYFVKGFIGATLYDSRNGFLYHLRKEAASFLSYRLDFNRDFSSGECELISNLQNRDLITFDNPNGWEGDIANLINEQRINFAWIEVTTCCNLKCIHCYESADSHHAANMQMETFTKIISELMSIGVKRVQLIGGEPMVSSLFKAFLDHIIGRFDFIEVYTNGTLITPAWVNYFKHNQIHVALSVYSYEPRNHDAVTGENGSWTKTNQAIKLLADAGVKYRVRNVLLNGISLGEKNTPLYTLNQNRDVVRMTGRANKHLLSPENLRKKLITKRSFSARIKKSRVIQCVSGNNCFATHLYFGFDGTIYPCVMERRMSHGNINDAPLATLLKQEILKFGKNRVDECRDCEYRYFCFDCRPDSLSDKLNDKPWNCTYHPHTGNWDDPDEYVSKLLGNNQ